MYKYRARFDVLCLGVYHFFTSIPSESKQHRFCRGDQIDNFNYRPFQLNMTMLRTCKIRTELSSTNQKSVNHSVEKHDDVASASLAIYDQIERGEARHARPYRTCAPPTEGAPKAPPAAAFMHDPSKPTSTRNMLSPTATFARPGQAAFTRPVLAAIERPVLTANAGPVVSSFRTARTSSYHTARPGSTIKQQHACDLPCRTTEQGPFACAQKREPRHQPGPARADPSEAAAD